VVGTAGHQDLAEMKQGADQVHHHHAQVDVEIDEMARLDARVVEARIVLLPGGERLLQRHGDHRLHAGVRVHEGHNPRFFCNGFYQARTGPMSGVRTGLAAPKKTTIVWAPNCVDRASSGSLLNPVSVSLKPLPTQALPAGSIAMGAIVCRPPM
jgi:hypothetical protein